MSHLGDKADFTPSPLIGSGSNRGCLTGETYDVVRSYGICSYRAGFSHPPYAPSKPLQPRRENGAERNRTAVRNTGVDHLVRSRTDACILASSTRDGIKAESAEARMARRSPSPAANPESDHAPRLNLPKTIYSMHKSITKTINPKTIAIYCLKAFFTRHATLALLRGPFESNAIKITII